MQTANLLNLQVCRDDRDEHDDEHEKGDGHKSDVACTRPELLGMDCGSRECDQDTMIRDRCGSADAQKIGIACPKSEPLGMDCGGNGDKYDEYEDQVSRKERDYVTKEALDALDGIGGTLGDQYDEYEDRKDAGDSADSQQDFMGDEERDEPDEPQEQEATAAAQGPLVGDKEGTLAFTKPKPMDDKEESLDITKTPNDTRPSAMACLMTCMAMTSLMTMDDDE